MGDTGVNEVVSEDFFESAKTIIINYFKLAIRTRYYSRS